MSLNREKLDFGIRQGSLGNSFTSQALHVSGDDPERCENKLVSDCFESSAALLIFEEKSFNFRVNLRAGYRRQIDNTVFVEIDSMMIVLS